MTDVIDNTAAGRFELTVDGGTAIAAYQREGDRIVFTHTEVPPELEGQGIGSRLVAGALARVRRQGLKVVPACAFVAAYLRRHPDAADLA
ncbi:N-acetyltransferase [Sphingomonas sp. MA1305]|uniref:GNAT family N-acetyltransferase n=1 Tax=Sphingomonas sp. MA1305 TaxID=2479204 RepID=UPI0018DF8587|nr:GNAT family N-acetyltransferase [Sphingomonas sp. MA1305]MBI0475897.1 N-acetyltransferase [Sphingomonas sp. MA1305]